MGKIEYTKTFYEAIGPGNGLRRLGLEWANTGQPVEVAIAWAQANYLPHEALPRIEAGLTPQDAAAIDEALIAEHGIIGAVAMQLQLEHPGATLIVDPDAEAAIEEIEGRQP